MRIDFAVSKIHRATVTDANLDYAGSITIPADLVEDASMFAGQMVHINNVANGAHWETYILKGNPGEIILNGPPAHHFKKGDIIIIVAYGSVEWEQAKDHSPRVVFVDGNNKIAKVSDGTL